MLITEPILAAIMNRYRVSLYFMCLRIVGRTDLAEDIVMETFEKVWQMRDQFATSTNLKAFIYLAAKNICRDARRHQDWVTERVYNMQDFDSIDPVVALDNRDILERAYRLVQRLGPKKAAIFYRTYMQDADSASIGRELGISTSTVTSTRHNFITLIRREIA